MICECGSWIVWLAGLRVGGIACWRDCGSWVVGIATRIAGSGIACVSAGLSVVQDCVVGGIVWLAGLPTRIARRGIAGLQAVGCQDCLRVGLPTGGIAACGIACRIACVGLRVCRRL